MSSHLRLLHLLVLFALIAPLGGCGAAEAEAQLYQVPMQDGTELATEVHLPAGEGPWPTVLLRSTYGRGVGHEGMVNDFLNRGYALVIQDVRGMGDSAGAPYVFHADGWRPDKQDGADTVDWIRAQPWSNDVIGGFGGSALAITQNMLAPATPHVDAQYMELVASDFYHDAAYPGGVWQKNMLEGWTAGIQQPHVADNWRAHPRDDDYWQWYDMVAQAENIETPGLFIGGWYDIFGQGTIDGFVSRQERGGEGARGKNMLIMKWGGHGADKSQTQFTGDFAADPNRYDLRISEVAAAWFDYHLHGKEDALDAYSAVHYYTIGDADAPDAPGNVWRTADTWPPFETTETPIFFGPDGTLRGEPPTAAGTASYSFDPNDPFPTLGGPLLLMPFGPYDQRAVTEGRDDYSAFVSEPLEQPLEITGRVRVRLFISTDAPDTDFTAKLLDIYPDGRQINMLDGIQRVKFRNGFETAAPLLDDPEEVVEVTVDLWSTSWVVNTGHRLAVHVSSSNFPRFEVNPNTGEDFPGDTLRAARQTIHFGPEHPSALLLPIREE